MTFPKLYKTIKNRILFLKTNFYLLTIFACTLQRRVVLYLGVELKIEGVRFLMPPKKYKKYANHLVLFKKNRYTFYLNLPKTATKK